MSACDLQPLEYNVVIEMDAPVDRIGSILLPPTALATERQQADEGTIAAISPLAFNFDNWPEGSRLPQLGDRVLVGRYTGVTREKDGTMWRIVKDKDIIAVIERAEAEPPSRLTYDEIVAVVEGAIA